jgi:hypothetical protein
MGAIKFEGPERADPKGGRAYVVDVVVKGEHVSRRLIWAASRAQARNHVAKSMIWVLTANAQDLARLWGQYEMEYIKQEPKPIGDDEA